MDGKSDFKENHIRPGLGPRVCQLQIGNHYMISSQDLNEDTWKINAKLLFSFHSNPDLKSYSDFQAAMYPRTYNLILRLSLENQIVT